MNSFDSELKQLLNRYSKENDSDTPDYILARYIQDCLDAYNRALQTREKWYGRDILNPQMIYDN